MIDLIDDSREIIFRFDTELQSAVEYFCIAIGHHYGEGGARFSLTENSLKKRNLKKYSVTHIKVKTSKKGYKFELGTHI